MATSATSTALALQERLVDAWIAQQRSPHTKTAYRTEITAFNAWCQRHRTLALRATSNLVASYATARQAAGDSPSTLRRRWSALSSFFDFAIVNEATTVNPLRGLSRPRPTSGDPSTTAQLSPQTVARYRLRAAELDPRLDLLVALLVADGLKLGEALALDVVDVRGRPPKVSLTVQRRNAPARIWLDPDSGRALYRCIGTRRVGPLFLSGTTGHGELQRLTRFGADHLVRQLSQGEPRRVTTNELRRYHITHSHDTEPNLTNVRERAGLAHTRSVRRYLIAPPAQVHLPASAHPATEPEG
jgi:integrase